METFWNLGGSGFGIEGPCKELQKFGPPFFHHSGGHNGCPRSRGRPRCRNPRWCHRCPPWSRSPLLWHRIGTSSKLSPLKACPAFCNGPRIPTTPRWIAGWVGSPVSRCGKKLFQILASLVNKIQIYCTLGWQGYLWKAWRNVRSLRGAGFKRKIAGFKRTRDYSHEFTMITHFASNLHLADLQGLVQGRI